MTADRSRLRANVDWCFVLDGGKTISCERCAKSYTIGLPISSTLYVRFVDAFMSEHEDCIVTHERKDVADGR